jgi:hypothetical protein
VQLQLQTPYAKLFAYASIVEVETDQLVARMEASYSKRIAATGGEERRLSSQAVTGFGAIVSVEQKGVPK